MTWSDSSWRFACGDVFNVARFVQSRSITPSILNMPFHVCHQLACTNGCIATLVAFIWLFSTMCFQMSLQIAWLTGCKVTLVAFVWLFSTVDFQMCFQGACITGFKITLVAFVWLFSTVGSQMSPQMACLRECRIALAAFFLFSLPSVSLIGISMPVFLPRSRCSRFWSISSM